MSAPYPVVGVKPEWVLEPEEMGSKRKFWYRQTAESAVWLFKFPQPNTGQHWAEKIAAEISNLLGVLHAKVELAVFEGQQGSITESFARGGRETGPRQPDLGDNSLRLRSQEGIWSDKSYRVEYLAGNGPRVCGPRSRQTGPSTAWQNTCYLDALIGNTDRHHENWGILRKRRGKRWTGFIAPSFDHASSLGRELLDVRRDRLLAENRVNKYAERGRGAVYWSEDERHAPSPLELVRRAAGKYPDLFRQASRKLERDKRS